MIYRREIDGLRAVAVLPVILFHAHFTGFSGGFVGVDVFFVISGYLIAGVVYGEIADGDFSLLRFYERRARRILPALFFVVVVCLPFAWFWMMPGEFKDFSQSVAAVVLFASNVLFWREAGYFAAGSDLKPLLHTWSLAVEEQFYVFFPVLLLMLARFGKRTVVVGVGLFCAASLGLAEVASHRMPDAAFYLLPARIWELGAGALLALASRRLPLAHGREAEAGGVLGLLLIAGSVAAFDGSFRFPGVWAVVPVAGTCLVLACASPATVVGRILGWQPMVALGLISYGAYLWHQPLFAFARMRLIYQPAPAVFAVLILAALVLAAVTYYLVEQPFRKQQGFSRSQVFAAAATASAVLLAVGAFGHVSDGYAPRLPGGVLEVAEAGNDLNPTGWDCMATPERPIPPRQACVHGAAGGPEVALWGDSHAMSISTALGLAVAAQGVGLRDLSRISCPPIENVFVDPSDPECLDHNDRVLAYLREADSPPVVVMMARWTLYLEGTRFDNGEGGAEFGKIAVALSRARAGEGPESPGRVGRVGGDIRSTIEALLDRGKRVVLVTPVPEAGWHVPNTLARMAVFSAEQTRDLSTDSGVFRARAARAHAELDALGERDGLLVVRPERIFCDAALPGRCANSLGGRPLYSDDDHVNSAGAALLAEEIAALMRGAAWL